MPRLHSPSQVSPPGLLLLLPPINHFSLTGRTTVTANAVGLVGGVGGVGGLAGSGGTAGTLISHLWIAACGPVGRLRSIDRIRKIVPALTGHE